MTKFHLEYMVAISVWMSQISAFQQTSIEQCIFHSSLTLFFLAQCHLNSFLLCLNSFLTVDDNIFSITLLSPLFYQYSTNINLRSYSLLFDKCIFLFTTMYSLNLTLAQKNKNSFVYMIYKYDYGLIHFVIQS